MLSAIIDAARAAGAVIQEVRSRDFAVASKGAAGPVTEADHRADALLRQRLLDLEPAGWLSEETADHRDRLGKSRLWVVDPLDGTREFIQGLPEYAVAIALVDRGEPVLAVVHNPATGDMFAAERGGGTTRNGDAVHVAEGRRCLASRSEMKRGEFGPFDDWELVAVGSIEYKLALVAAGDAAMTLSRGPKHEWDVCAGHLLVTEAGGTVTDVFGGPLRYNQPFPKTRGVLAGAPEAYHRATELVRQTGASDRMKEFDR
jgi:myo-inositol-1(or 4)-monophosphatase